MVTNSPLATLVARCRILAAYGLLAVCGSSALAQQLPVAPGVHFRVEGATQQLEMIVNTSRILTLDKKVPKALVNNPDVVKITPLSPNQIQISAVKAGVTQVNLWDEDEAVHSLDIVVTPDGRELDRLLKSEFPDAAIKVRPLASSVIISGYVPRPDMVTRIVKMSEDYYPKVINNMSVGGVQQVALHVKVMEVSRTKLRTLGFDWADINGNDFVVQSVSGLISATATQAGTATGSGDTVRFGVVDGSNSFFGFLEALRRYDLVKVLAEPTLVTVSGRPASFNSGGQFPIIVPQSLGTVSVEYRQFGTRVDFVPIVIGNGNIRLECRPQVSEIDNARSVTINNISVPGLRERWVDTAVEMRAGQTLALAGLIQERTESQNKGLPILADLPWAGAAFRRVTETTNEVELLIMVTPELIDATDEAPACGPGETTTSPRDCDLYGRGYLEVPKCHGNCAQGGCQNEPVIMRGEQVQPRQAAPMGPQPVPVPMKSTTAPTFPKKAGVRAVPAAHTQQNGSPQLLGPTGYDVLE